MPFALAKLCLRQFSILTTLYTQTGPESSSKLPRPLLAWSRKMVGKLMQLVNTVYVLWCIQMTVILFSLPLFEGLGQLCLVTSTNTMFVKFGFLFSF